MQSMSCVDHLTFHTTIKSTSLIQTHDQSVVYMEHGEKLCRDVKIGREFTYLGDMVCAGRGHEAAVTARTRFGWVMFWEGGNFL